MADPVRAFCNAPPPPRIQATRLIGLALGGVAYYACMRRLGAPRWAAVGLADIALRQAVQAVQKENANGSN